MAGATARFRHCEPTGRANARPMTGSAKQSRAAKQDWIASSQVLLAMTGSDCRLQLVVRVDRRVAVGLVLLLARLLVGAMAAVGAAGNGAEHAVMAGIMPGNAADRGALQAALGLGRIGGQRQRGDGKQGGD